MKTVRIGPPLDENFGIDFNAQGRMFLPETPDANGDQSIIRMNTAGNDLATFTSTKITERLRGRCRQLNYPAHSRLASSATVFSAPVGRIRRPCPIGP